METIKNNLLRVGNFTSSEIVALTKEGKQKGSFGALALTYIEECNMERRLGRSLNDDSNAKAIVWGKFLESRAFDLLGMEYTLNSQETVIHPLFQCWSGSADGFKNDSVIDIKCPFTLKSFCQLVDCGGDINKLRETHKDGDKYYWQLVSNAIINNKPFAELVVYLPYQSELQEIREATANYDGDQHKLMFINLSTDDEIPYLVDGGYYKNLNIIRFEVPQADKDFLHNKVVQAEQLLSDYFV